MKRAITFMMALVLVLSLSVSAFADGGPGVITITNTTVGETYSVYKIFNATYNTNGDVAYTLENSTLENLMFGATAVEYTEVDENGNTVTIGKAEDFFNFDATTKVVTLKDTADTAKLFKYLGKLVTESSITAADTKTANAASLEFSGLDTGYYVIKRASAAANAVTITTTKPTATVIDKNQLPGGDFNKDVSNDGINWEADDKNSLGVGDTVYFKLNFTATNYDGDEKVTYYKITDTMEPANWADIDISSIVVKVAGSTITNYTVTETANGFEINIPWVSGAGEFLYPDVTSVVEVTYDAVVTEDAANKDAVANKNSAQLDWDYDSEPDAPGSETETDVFNMGFTKVDGADPTKTLSGAVFGLYSDAACTTPVNVKPSATGPVGVYVLDTATTGATNQVTTPANGQVVIMGLAEGTYYLKEITPPAGYNQLPTAQDVVVAATTIPTELTYGEGEDAVTYKLNHLELDILNNKGVELPSTGGKGTMMLITFGSIVAMAFAVLMITQKKMSIYQD